MTVISSCSRSNYRFRKRFQLLLAIVHPLCGSMHVVRPSSTLILVLSRRSSKSNDSARILTYPPSGCDGVPCSKNQSMPISPCTSCSSRSRGSSTASSLEGASHCASAVSPVLDCFCWTHFIGDVDWCSTGCIASWCHHLCFSPNVGFQAHLRASHHKVPFSCFA